MKLNPDDDWVRIAKAIDWKAVEERYRAFFPSSRGRPAATARIALGALIIQCRTGLSDRKLVEEIGRNPYYQYFLGLESFQEACPFKHGILPAYRKRFGMGFLTEINEIILRNAPATPAHARDKAETPSENGNLGTAILDATCSPSNIRYPQDFSLLNEGREKLDTMIDTLHAATSEIRRPRTYRRALRKKYLAFAKSKRRTAKDTRRIVRIMLCAVKRNLGFVDAYLAAGGRLARAQEDLLATIRELYRQQKEMFVRQIHRIEKRIVSVTQPFVRPIVRGKAKAPVEFGAKYDVSIDERGHARLEHASFEPYNENTVLQDVVEKYKARTGHYPARVLVDRIYRTKANRDYCGERGIVMSGRKPGRKTQDPKAKRKAENQERRNDKDRIEVERFFSVDKRCYGAGLVMTKLSETTLGSIALSILVANLFGTVRSAFFVFYFMESCGELPSCHLLEIEEDAE